MKKTYKIDVDCANCANKMEDAAKKADTVTAESTHAGSPSNKFSTFFMFMPERCRSLHALT